MTAAAQPAEKPNVCVDFDGVLNDYHGWQGEENLGEPAEGAGEFLEALSGGYRVVIHTTRRPTLVWAWLHRLGWDMFVASVTPEKPPAICYVDDRAVRHDGDFLETLNEVDSFAAYWEENAREPWGIAQEYHELRRQHG